MKKVLLAYYPLGEVQKVIARLEKLFKERKFKVVKEQILLKQEVEIKKQFKIEKKLVLRKKPLSIKSFDLVVIGTPIVSFSSVPAVNVFIRNLKSIEDKKFALVATGIGLPGTAIKKMQSILLMRRGKVVASQVFSSIFEFDERKLKEVEKLFAKLIDPKLQKNL
jgi:hypothetical protein